MALTFAQWKSKFIGLLADEATDAGEAAAHAGHALERVVTFDFSNVPRSATTSISLPVAEAASQPLRERVVHVCPHKSKLVKAYYALHLATTQSNTDCWNLLIQKRGGSFSTASGTNTYSLTRLIATLTSSSVPTSVSATGSYSTLTYNVANRPNPCMLQDTRTGFANSDGVATELGKGDVITAQITKNGVGFACGRGGTLVLVLEEG